MTEFDCPHPAPPIAAQIRGLSSRSQPASRPERIKTARFPAWMVRRASTRDEEPQNPWLALDQPSLPAASPPAAQFALPEIRPNAAIAPPPAELRLPERQIRAEELAVRVWWLSAHGGAGESTIAALTERTAAAGHAWPLSPGHAPRTVVLLGRTNLDGLTAVQRALAHWGSGLLEVNLAGLVLVADAPGKLPRPLRDFARVLQQAAPGPECLIPWQPEWRLGNADPAHVRKHVKPLVPKEDTA